MAKVEIKRGDIFYADLSPVIGSEQGGMRPVVIVQNDIGNHYSPTVIVAAITARIQKPKMPTHVGINSEYVGIEKDSVILLEQIRTIDKQRLRDRVTHLDDDTMKRVDHALLVSIGLLNQGAKHKQQRSASSTYKIKKTV
ncbi:type II toxin-antitoxin system PemK/MazF family toxin [Paucilactobacillus suebicus]|nr:type II toxin-antitoxin system PemK/MazF family toxin [Paucilactobacillus suebicus]